MQRADVNQRRLLLLAIAVALLGAGWTATSRVTAATAAVAGAREAPRAGFVAPRIRSELLTRAPFELEALRGRVVVLNFWATWCAPCRAEMPALQALYDRRRSDGLVVVGVNQLEETEDVIPFVEHYALTFPIALDRDGAISQRYNVRGLPTTFFVNRQGVIRDVVIGGPMDSALLESKVSALLRE